MTDERTMRETLDIEKSPGFHGRCYGGPLHQQLAGCMAPVMFAPILQPLHLSLCTEDTFTLPAFDVCEYTFETLVWPGRRYRLSIDFWLAKDYTLTYDDTRQLFYDAVMKAEHEQS